MAPTPAPLPAVQAVKSRSGTRASRLMGSVLSRKGRRRAEQAGCRVASGERCGHGGGGTWHTRGTARVVPPAPLAPSVFGVGIVGGDLVALEEPTELRAMQAERARGAGDV